MIYSNSSGHTITPVSIAPIELYSTSDLDNISQGQTVTGEDGSKATITTITHITGRIYRVVLIPQEP